ncbi:MAG: phosphatidylglycerophosphatase A [Smithellaceae bacterium]|nr:phosphatidylglycerophosphatase A [Smithellaceae bacterium]
MCPLRPKLNLFLASGFGSGFLPFAPGTFGTVAGIPVYLAFSLLKDPAYLIVLAALTGAACYIAGEAEKTLGKKDAPAIVIDEIVGLLFTLVMITPTAAHVLTGFLLFRFFDITKIFPAGYVQDKLPGGYGVVADDVVAGIYANIVLQIVTRIWGL